MSMQKNILITGKPKSGKSTLLQKIIKTIPNKIGFVTPEIRENGERVGFTIETSDGGKFTLAHVNFETPHKVSKYFVDIPSFEKGIEVISNFNDSHFLYIDEIGQAQLFSDNFKDLVLNYFNSSNKCLVTLTCVYEDGFISEIKKRDDVTIIEITPENREEQEKNIIRLIALR